MFLKFWPLYLQGLKREIRHYYIVISRYRAVIFIL